MKTKYAVAIIAAGLGLAAITGCSKPASGTKANQGISDLGVVEVSDGVQIQRDLGSGRVCTIILAIQKDGTVLLSMKITQDGNLLTAPRIQTASDHAAVITVGDITVGVTPHIKQ